MSWLSNDTLVHLRRAIDRPQLPDARYRLLEPLGEGGMGTVWLAHDEELNREVAVKTIRESALSADAIDRMMREARILAQLEHPGMVPVHDVGRLPDGRVYYVMKRVKGHRLDEHFDADATLHDRLRVFERICETVAFAHAHGVIHRDLKPQNVMVGEFGEVLVLDWGVAKVRAEPDRVAPASADDGNRPGDYPPPGSAQRTTFGTVIGTPGYMAPEQARGETASIDRRSDVYALGAILYFLLIGIGPPRDGSQDPRPANSSAPRQIAAVCMKATASGPNERYDSATELAEEVHRFLAGLPVHAYREGPFERFGRWVRRYQVPILLIAAYLLARTILFFSARR